MAERPVPVRRLHDPAPRPPGRGVPAARPRTDAGVPPVPACHRVHPSGAALDDGPAGAVRLRGAGRGVHAVGRGDAADYE